MTLVNTKFKKLVFSFSSSIKIKTNLTLISILTIAFSALSIFIYQSINERIQHDTHTNMVNQLTDLNTILEDHVRARQENVNISIKLAENIFNQYGNIKESTSTIEVLGIDQETKEKKKISLAKWHINNQALYNNTEIINRLKSAGIETSSIFQKIDEGYLRISTSVQKQDGTSALDTYIPNSSDVVKTIEQGETYYGRAFVVDTWYLTTYKPFRVNGRIQGILFAGIKEMDYDAIKRVFAEKKYFDNGYPFLISEEGTLIVHPNSEGENLAQTNFFGQLHHSQQKINKSEYIWPETKEGKEKIQYFTYFAPYKSYIATSVYKEDMYAGLNKLIRTTLIIILLSGLLVYIALNLFLSPIINNMKTMALKAEQIAAGDLTTHVFSKRTDEIGQLANALNTMIKKLRDIVNVIVLGAHQINNSSIQFDNTSQDISQSASQQASSIEEVSSTMEEISTSIETNTTHSVETEKIAVEVAQEVLHASEKAQKAQHYSKMIAQKITVINDISMQTNILSLNAAIEASKAGVHGRGFSVVADQVRKLAESSKAMAEEIAILVNDSVEMSLSTSDKLQSIIPSIEKTSLLVQNITSANTEIGYGVQQINTALQQINASTAENVAGSEELAAGAKELSGESNHLIELVAYFKTERQTQLIKKEVSSEDLLQAPINKKTIKPKPSQTKGSSPVSMDNAFKVEEYERF